jgi:hypothetical protein
MLAFFNEEANACGTSHQTNKPFVGFIQFISQFAVPQRLEPVSHQRLAFVCHRLKGFPRQLQTIPLHTATKKHRKSLLLVLMACRSIKAFVTDS